MDIEITNEEDNSLFNRKEITGKVKVESSPQREDVMEALAEKYSTSLDNIKVKGIKGSFGSSEFKVEANIYSNKEEKETTENKKKKDTELEKKRAEAQKAEEEKKASSEEESGEEKTEESSQ